MNLNWSFSNRIKVDWNKKKNRHWQWTLVHTKMYDIWITVRHNHMDIFSCFDNINYEFQVNPSRKLFFFSSIVVWFFAFTLTFDHLFIVLLLISISIKSDQNDHVRQMIKANPTQIPGFWTEPQSERSLVIVNYSISVYLCLCLSQKKTREKESDCRLSVRDTTAKMTTKSEPINSIAEYATEELTDVDASVLICHKNVHDTTIEQSITSTSNVTDSNTTAIIVATTATTMDTTTVTPTTGTMADAPDLMRTEARSSCSLANGKDITRSWYARCNRWRSLSCERRKNKSNRYSWNTIGNQM